MKTIKRIVVLLFIAYITLPLFADDITIPSVPNDLKGTKIEIQFDDNGDIESIEIWGKLVNGDTVIKHGAKDITADVPIAHKTNYETYMAVYINNIKALLGL